jgi:hypothetical protein
LIVTAEFVTTDDSAGSTRSGGGVVVVWAVAKDTVSTRRSGDRIFIRVRYKTLLLIVKRIISMSYGGQPGGYFLF